MAGRRAGAARRRNRLLHLLAYGLEGDVERLERHGGDALTLADQPEQDVLGADVVVVEEASLLLSEEENSSCAISEALEHGCSFTLATVLVTAAQRPGLAGLLLLSRPLALHRFATEPDAGRERRVTEAPGR
jgi:hypothetical protein